MPRAASMKTDQTLTFVSMAARMSIFVIDGAAARLQIP
jgi:hypothetical protein